MSIPSSSSQLRPPRQSSRTTSSHRRQNTDTQKLQVQIGTPEKPRLPDPAPSSGKGKPLSSISGGPSSSRLPKKDQKYELPYLPPHSYGLPYYPPHNWWLPTREERQVLQDFLGRVPPRDQKASMDKGEAPLCKHQVRLSHYKDFRPANEPPPGTPRAYMEIEGEYKADWRPAQLKAVAPYYLIGVRGNVDPIHDDLFFDFMSMKKRPSDFKWTTPFALPPDRDEPPSYSRPLTLSNVRNAKRCTLQDVITAPLQTPFLVGIGPNPTEVYRALSVARGHSHVMLRIFKETWDGTGPDIIRAPMTLPPDKSGKCVLFGELGGHQENFSFFAPPASARQNAKKRIPGALLPSYPFGTRLVMHCRGEGGVEGLAQAVLVRAEQRPGKGVEMLMLTPGLSGRGPQLVDAHVAARLSSCGQGLLGHHSWHALKIMVEPNNKEDWALDLVYYKKGDPWHHDSPADLAQAPTYDSVGMLPTTRPTPKPPSKGRPTVQPVLQDVLWPASRDDKGPEPLTPQETFEDLKAIVAPRSSKETRIAQLRQAGQEIHFALAEGRFAVAAAAMHAVIDQSHPRQLALHLDALGVSYQELSNGIRQQYDDNPTDRELAKWHNLLQGDKSLVSLYGTFSTPTAGDKGRQGPDGKGKIRPPPVATPLITVPAAVSRSQCRDLGDTWKFARQMLAAGLAEASSAGDIYIPTKNHTQHLHGGAAGSYLVYKKQYGQHHDLLRGDKVLTLNMAVTRMCLDPARKFDKAMLLTLDFVEGRDVDLEAYQKTLQDQ